MTQPEVELSGRRPRASARLSRQGRQPRCLPLPPPSASQAQVSGGDNAWQPRGGAVVETGTGPGNGLSASLGPRHLL